MNIDPSKIIGGVCALVVSIPVIGAILHGHRPPADYDLDKSAKRNLRQHERDAARIAHENRKARRSARSE